MRKVGVWLGWKVTWEKQPLDDGVEDDGQSSLKTVVEAGIEAGVGGGEIETRLAV